MNWTQTPFPLQITLDSLTIEEAEGYINSGIDVINENQNIIMIGNFEDVSEHTQSIKESIEEIDYVDR